MGCDGLGNARWFLDWADGNGRWGHDDSIAVVDRLGFAAVAVGTDLVWNALTKTVGASVHYRRKNVNLGLVWRLASGIIPGALLGLYLLGWLKMSAGVKAVDHLIVRLRVYVQA